ncbi:MAG: choice-of-anchor D domain-containing protein [Acidobacteriaceae bacterium]|nr:choice-of-anchor D domain-containing protein [Acidobacteriaceae bacterium]MBV9499547.1 choice-of-anchor D domain-containing protein [Acidobacteriaceae bacterium]
MKPLLLSLLICGAVSAQTQTLSFAIHDPSGKNPDVPFTSPYQFPDTEQGSASSVILSARNDSGSTVMLVYVYVVSAANSGQQDPDFTITGLNVDSTLAPGQATHFTINFRPSTTGPLSGYLQAAYEVQQNNCVLGGSNTLTACSETITPVSTLQGTGVPATLTLSYLTANGPVQLLPSSTSPLNFGNISASASASITFALTNNTSQPVTTPAVSLQTEQFAYSAFALDTSQLPATIPANGSANFTVTFAPGQTGLSTATLVVGSNSYPLAGTGITVTDIDALQISYVDSTGVRGLPEAATPINFGQLVAGTNTSNTLTFTVANPTTSLDPVTLTTLAVSGSGFTLSNAPSLPVSIAPGSSITFQVSLSASSQGTSSGTLTIGTRVFTLTGQSVSLPLPGVSFQLSQQPLTSRQQVTLTINLASPSPIAAIGQLAMEFTPSVANISDDPAVMFVAHSTRQLSVNVALNAKTATYNGQSGLVLQTGTTAGTIKFTLTFPDLAPITQSFTITPAPIEITSATASWQEPNLVVTVTGFDNTYSAGNIVFDFYDTKGNTLVPGGMAVNATTSFHNYFFNNDPAGGAFSMQATFPVSNGDVSQIGSVAVTMSNSVGQTSSNQIQQ